MAAKFLRAPGGLANPRTCSAGPTSPLHLHGALGLCTSSELPHPPGPTEPPTSSPHSSLLRTPLCRLLAHRDITSHRVILSNHHVSPKEQAQSWRPQPEPWVQSSPGVRSSTGTHAWGVSRASRSVWPGWGRGPPKHMLLTSPRQPLPSLGDRRSASCSPSMPATVPACLMPRCPGVPHPSFLRYSEGARTSLLAEVTPSLKPFGDRVTWLQEASAHKVPMAWGAPHGSWGLQH